MKLQELVSDGQVMDSYSHDEITSQCFLEDFVQLLPHTFIYLLLWQPFNKENEFGQASAWLL